MTRPLCLTPIILAAAMLLPPRADAAELVDGIAAQVGTEVVLISEVHRIADPIEKRMRAQGVDDSEIAQMKAGVLDSLIENRLLDITAERVEVEALDEEPIHAAAHGPPNPRPAERQCKGRSHAIHRSARRR